MNTSQIWLLTAALALAAAGCGGSQPRTVTVQHGEVPAAGPAPLDETPAAALDRLLAEFDQRLKANPAAPDAARATEQTLAALKLLADSGSPLAEQGLARVAQVLDGRPDLKPAALAYLQANGLEGRYSYLFVRPDLAALAVPAPAPPAPAPAPGAGQPPAPTPTLLPVAVRPSPDGKAFALWHALQADGLVAWRSGDRQSVALTGVARRDLAWAPDGLYFVQLTGPMDGRPQVLRYRWGQPKPEVVIDTPRLKGHPRALAWDAAGGRLLYADDDGLKAAAADGRTLVPIKGPPVPQAVQGGAFGPAAGLRYVTAAEGQLLVAAAGQEGAAVAAKLAPGVTLHRVAWASAGDRAAAEVGPAGRGGTQVVLVSVPAQGAPAELRRLEGTAPVLFPDRLYYLAAGGRVMEVRLPDGAPRQVAAFATRDLVGDAAAGRLYLFLAGQTLGEVPYLDVK